MLIGMNQNFRLSLLVDYRNNLREAAMKAVKYGHEWKAVLNFP